MPRALARALERRTAPPLMISRDGKPFIEYGAGAGSPLWPEFTDPDLILARMDAAGIDHAVLTVTIPGVDWFDAEEGEELAESANEETAAIVARHPHRFSGLATVPLQAPDRATAVLQRALGKGFLVPHNGSFIPYVEGRIDMIAEARPGASGAIKVPPSAHIKKFYVDTVCGSTQSVRYCCDFFGADHVMHGTDHPFFPMTSGLGVLEALELSREDREKIEYRNASQLFRIQLPARDQ